MGKGQGVVGLTELARLWKRQAEQQAFWYRSSELSAEERASIARDLLLEVYEEISELARVIHKPMQHHIVQRRETHPADVLEECVDAFKYLTCIMQLYGINSTEFIEHFWRKTSVVDDRRKAADELLSHEQVLLVDLDGCLADLEGGFRSWMNAQGKECLEDYSHPRFNLDKDEFQRTGELARLQLVYEGAVEFLNASQFMVIIVTSRPQHRFKNIYSDTVGWLARVGLNYRNIIFTMAKEQVIEQVRPAAIVGFVEDYYKYAIPIALSGVRVYKLPSGSDVHYAFKNPNLIEVSDWEQIKQHLEAGDG